MECVCVVSDRDRQTDGLLWSLGTRGTVKAVVWVEGRWMSSGRECSERSGPVHLASITHFNSLSYSFYYSWEHLWNWNGRVGLWANENRWMVEMDPGYGGFPLRPMTSQIPFKQSYSQCGCHSVLLTDCWELLDCLAALMTDWDSVPLCLTLQQCLIS